MFQGLAHLGNLFWAKAQLAGLAAGVPHIQNPEGMTFPARAFRTATGVMDGAFKQRAAQNLA